jgi:deazaflavin-dependent oxidoreductase (nitroreductase family)
MPQGDPDRELKYIYLTTLGRVSGLPREIEIWFVQSQGKFYVLAEHFRQAQWVQNIECNSRVRVRLGQEQFDATARVLDGEGDRATWEMAQRLSNEKYGWGEGLPVEIERVTKSDA